MVTRVLGQMVSCWYLHWRTRWWGHWRSEGDELLNSWARDSSCPPKQRKVASLN
jgi:hypothetical protein